LKKYLFLPIYNKNFKIFSYHTIVEQYFIDLYGLNNNKIIIEDLSYDKNKFIENYKFINKKKAIYKKEILKKLKEKNIFLSNKLESSIDYWLIHFLSIIKHRYDKLLILKNRYKKIHLPYCSFHKFNFHRTEDFNKCFTNNSINNIYIFQEIAKVLNLRLINFDNKIIMNKFQNKEYNKTLEYYFIKILLKFKKINLFIGLYYNSKNYISKLLFFLKERGLSLNISTFTLPVDIANNNKDINIKVKENDLFDIIINKFISDFFPKIFYSNDNLKNLYNLKKNIKSLSSSIALASSDDFRILASFLGKKKVITYQHGSDYDQLKYNFLDKFEKTYSNFYSWKKKKSFNIFFEKIKSVKDNQSKISINHRKRKQKIIFFSSIAFHNIVRYESYFVNFKSNLDLIRNTAIFRNSLKNSLKKNFIYRDTKHNYGWAYKKIFLKYSSQKNLVKFFKSDSSLEAMKNSKIIITDHISTPLYEALQLNIPILVFCDINKYIFTNKIKKAFLLLRKNNIIFDNPESCSKFLNNHYDDIEKIWASKDVQDSLKNFKNICF
tara:strand:- start:1190 stop:2842 length:1653 start_codon:yes stop_codon:yes gene_type:complete